MYNLRNVSCLSGYFRENFMFLTMGTTTWHSSSPVSCLWDHGGLNLEQATPGKQHEHHSAKRKSTKSTNLHVDPEPTETRALACPVAETIANIFWRPSLTFHPYQYGDKPICFHELWLRGNRLRNLLLESVFSTDLRQSVLDFCLFVLRCGPVDVLKILIDGKIIGAYLLGHVKICI